MEGDGAPPLLGAYFERRAELLRFLTARTGSPAEAEDLLQELYLRLSGVQAQVENDRAYLYRLASNLVLDRARQARRAAVRDLAYREVTVERLAGEDVADAPDPEQTAVARSRLARLQARLQGLPAKTREIFRLHKFEGLSHEETARRVGLSRSAVEKHVSAALKQLMEDDE